jgi:hypothetical protein
MEIQLIPNSLRHLSDDPMLPVKGKMNDIS